MGSIRNSGLGAKYLIFNTVIDIIVIISIWAELKNQQTC